MEGKVFYQLDDAGRRARGVPRIDTHVYAEENGLALAALAALYDATGDRDVVARARRRRHAGVARPTPNPTVTAPP